MIERRRPILSAIANRRMFMGGGMATPMPQPTYMDLMPQQMGIPREAQGIMASSQPLVDAIAGDANNPYGGDTLSMAQGGVAKFQRGGLSRAQSSSMALPYATNQQMAAGQILADKQAPFAPLKGPRPTIGIGESPEDMLRRRGTTPSELVNEMFPYSASTGRSFLGPDMMRPGFVGTDPRGESSPIERGGQFVVDFIDQTARVLSQISNAFGRTIKDVGEGFVTRAPSDIGTATIISQVSAVNDALRRMPKVRGVSDEELGATIKDIAEAATTAQPDISGDELGARIAEGVLSKYEGPLSEGYAMARDDANRRIVDAAPQEGFPTPQLGYEMAAEDADRTLVDGVAEAEYQNELNSKIEEYRIAMAESARLGGNPDAQMKFTQELLANPNYDQSFKNAVFEAGDVGFSEKPTEAPVTGDESTRDVPRPKEKPPVPENAFEGLVPRGEEEEDATTGATPSASTAAATPDATAAAQVAKAFDKPMTKPEAEKTIEDYKRDFMKAMPEYEGVSEEEKGYRFIEAGLRVMAGQSPNAIENIANGLKGLGAEFAKDEKEKRAYDRQVDLSAANYALGAIAKDVAQDRADERNRIVMYDMTDPKNPKSVSVGMDQILANDGRLPDNLVGKEIMSAKVKAANDATVRLRTLLSENAKSMRITATEAKDLRDSLGKARESFVSGESGIQLLSQVKARVAAGDVTGFGVAGRELIRQAFAAAGKQDLLNKKYTSLSEAREEIRRAFQALIPISLGSTQTANSISNRDVQFLADAYVNSGFLENGVFSFATVNDETLGQQLEGAISKFRNRQKEGLADYDRVLSRINSAEQAFQDARGSGMFVSPGPFTSSYFDPLTKEIDPYAQKTRAFLEGRTAKPVFTYEFKDGVYRRVPAR